MEDAGLPVVPDGHAGTFEVEEASPDAPGFFSVGRLEYVGKHLLQFAGSKEYFLKGGADSPEKVVIW